MMIHDGDVNFVFPRAVQYLKENGIRQESRNGPVLAAPGPVMLTYDQPDQRILWCEHRDANPFFHLMESLWMLAGRDDARYVEQFNSRMGEYAEPDGYIHGAYGARWRWKLQMDQLKEIINLLRQNPSDRRIVLQMWDTNRDLGTGYRDVPCNTHAYFRVLGGALEMTVCNRSNDLLWGACGANVVHFSILQEFIASSAGLAIGPYHQFTNNLHLYTDVQMVQEMLENPELIAAKGEYSSQLSFPLLQNSSYAANFLYELPRFLERDYSNLTQPFLFEVAMPMQEYYLQRKAGGDPFSLLDDMPYCDWREAALRWRARREQRKPNMVRP